MSLGIKCKIKMKGLLNAERMEAVMQKYSLMKKLVSIFLIMSCSACSFQMIGNSTRPPKAVYFVHGHYICILKL